MADAHVKAGEGGQYPGVDSKTAWYNRNLRIFANLQRLTEQPGERILLVIGAGPRADSAPRDPGVARVRARRSGGVPR